MQKLLKSHCILPVRMMQTVRYLKARNETYYDILQVSQNCTTKDIRNAFVRLSKQCHPDVKGMYLDPKQNKQTNDKFVQIAEAYQTLSKPRLRNAYDQRLWHASRQSHRASQSTAPEHRTVMSEIHKPWDIKPDHDPNPDPSSYYGVKGMRRVSNFRVAFVIAAIFAFGALFGFASLKQAFTFNREKLDEKSAAANLYHRSVREAATKYGNEEQLRRMVNRMSREER